MTESVLRRFSTGEGCRGNRSFRPETDRTSVGISRGGERRMRTEGDRPSPPRIVLPGILPAEGMARSGLRFQARATGHMLVRRVRLGSMLRHDY